MNKIHTRIIFTLLILGAISAAFIINGASAPSKNKVPGIGNVAIVDITDTSVNIVFTVDQPNARTRVYYGKTTSLGTWSNWNDGTSSSRNIVLSGLKKNGTYFISVYAHNKSDGNYSSHSPTESFRTTGVEATNTAPNITNIIVDSITASTANITFLVDQPDARTIVHYGTTTSLGKLSNENNDTSLSRTIMLTDLLEKTKYNFSIYAHNGSDKNYSSHSPIQSFKTVSITILNGTAPNITNIIVEGITDSTANVTFLVDQLDARTRINYGKTESLGAWSDWNNDTSSSRRIMLHNLLNTTNYNFSIRAYNGTNPNNYTDSEMKNFTTKNLSTSDNPNDPNPPNIGVTTPEKSIHTIIKESINFTASFDQVVNVTWYLNGTLNGVSNSTIVKTEDMIKSSYYVNNISSVGKWNVTVVGANKNGTVSYSWEWFVEPVTYRTGNRIWDGTKGMSTTYMWNSFSFAGFYYDIDNNMSTEELIIKNIKRTIDDGDITYTTSPIEVNFEYSNFGKYQVVGFMADKYFAGYKNGTIPGPTSSFDDINALSQGQLHKVLIDEDIKRTITVGGTLALKDGYVLKATDIDMNARTMLLVLLKDGTEVDSTPLSKDQTYVYKKRVGNVEDLPLILVRFDNVFSGQESQVAFLKGIFQISETATSIKVGDEYGKMEVSSIGNNNIVMKNRESISLSPKAKIDLMGDLKIIVADSDTLRFALSVERKGTFEVRGTVYPVTDQWTPMNFGLDVGGKNIGFYYDLDEDIGTENLNIESVSGTSIPSGKLVYSTSPQQVSFSYSNFGKYQVIGFMADKYFAGYKGHTISNPTNSFDDVSALSQGQLHKVLIDDDTKRTISVGGTLALKDGYVLKATDIDLNARTMLLVLLKDGVEVDSTPLQKDETYVYKKRVGDVEDLPLILARFDNVFSGQELQVAFLKGLFQISETATSIKVGNSFGNMEVKTINKDSITMANDGSIGLSKGNTVNVMGNIKFKVADSTDLRFYPFVLVTPDMVGTQLMINMPSKATGGDTINISVTAGGTPIGDVSITIIPETGAISRSTNSNGTTNFTFPIKSNGTYTITATKLGYENANKTIYIQKYIENTLSISIPTMADQFVTIPIQTVSNGKIVSGATITYDNTTIGSTDSDGILNYKLESSGTHTITASKSGYVTVSRDIDVRAPFSEFKAQDIHIAPDKIFTGEEIIIRSNVTNVGTKTDTKYVNLIVNGTVVDNRSITLDPKEINEINFTHRISLPEGNYTIEILEQKGLIEVEKSSTNILLIVAIITIIGIIAIYMVTTKKGKDMTSELVKKGRDVTNKLIKK